MRREKKPLIPAGSRITQKVVPPPEPDLLTRIVERKNRQENTNSSEHITSNTVIQLDGNTSNRSLSEVNHITSNTLASSENLTNSPLKTVDNAAVERVKALVSGKTKTVGYKCDDGIDEAISEWVAAHWRDKSQKQDVLRRALMLFLYEQETGQALVDFGDAAPLQPGESD